MKYFTLLISCFFIFSSIGQTIEWKSYELAKGLKISIPDKMEKRMVRDLEMHYIEGGNYDWKIISMPLSSFTRDNDQVNFLGESENVSNEILVNPYVQKIKDSVFLLKGNQVRSILYKQIDPTDTNQNYTVWQFYMQTGEQVYVSNLKYFKESKLQYASCSHFFEDMKLPKGESADLEVKGVKSFFKLENKKSFLKKVYCDYPVLKKSKSYHKILSLNVEFELTETGKVSRVRLDPSKMIMITRESETELEEFFQTFSFKLEKKSIEQENRRFNFVLFLQDYPKKLFCK
ncbi:MAG: hypothetical protein KDC84_09705 [Crocinitomicaceae bacterium]|nr:hypothetical protein [Crocinitomicaceae bacterium]